MADSAADPLQLKLRVGDMIGPYRIIDSKIETRPNGEEATPLGSGATSLVFKCEQTLSAGIIVPRAVKLFAPSGDLIQKRQVAGLSDGIGSFLQEIASISGFNHQNLVKVIDAGTREGYPFLVMEFADGPTLKDVLEQAVPEWEFWKDKAMHDPTLLMRFIHQLCWPLAYLHAQNFYHMDVAPKNIFLRRVNDRPHLVLGDLGVGQFISDQDVIDKKQCPIRGTRKYTPPELTGVLNTGRMPADQLRPLARYWDLYAAIIILEEMIEKWKLGEANSLKAGQLLCEKIKTDSDWKTEKRNAETLAHEFNRLMPEQYVTAGVNELSQSSTGNLNYIRIPLYSVGITKRIRALIDHPAFERLRLAPQLLLVRTVHPGGMHTRFEHALGCYELGRRYLLQLLSQPNFRAIFGQKELEEALLVVLLSNLDVFPLHHVVAEVVPEISKKDLLGTDVSMFKWIMNVTDNGRMPKSLKSLTAELFSNVDVDWIISILNQTANVKGPREVVTRMLIDSSIDVKVADYLVRDAHHTGVNAGTNIDVDHIVESLRFLSRTKRLGIDKSGVHAVENLLCARYWMYTRVYWNAIHRSLVAMLRYTFDALVCRGTLDLETLVKELSWMDETAVLKKLDDWWVKHVNEENKEYSILPLLRSPRPKSFLLACEYSNLTSGIPGELIRTFAGMSHDKTEQCRRALLIKLNSTGEFGNVKINDVLFDIPRESIERKLGGDIDIELNSKGEMEGLDVSSDLIASLPNAFEKSARKLRVFVSPAFADSIGLRTRKAGAFIKIVDDHLFAQFR